MHLQSLRALFKAPGGGWEHQEVLRRNGDRCRRVWEVCDGYRTELYLLMFPCFKDGDGVHELRLVCKMIRHSGSGNHTLSRISDGITITNDLSNSGVETSGTAWNGRFANQPTVSI